MESGNIGASCLQTPGEPVQGSPERALTRSQRETRWELVVHRSSLVPRGVLERSGELKAAVSLDSKLQGAARALSHVLLKGTQGL